MIWNLHTTSEKPDWEQLADKLSLWQRLAIHTNGIVTPGNVLSVAGLVVAAIGSFRLYQGAWQTGLLLVTLGRFFDLLDGVVAELTHTKSQLGETVDAACDKLAVLALIVFAYAGNLLSPVLLIALLAHHAYAALFGTLWGRRYQLHTNRTGKLAMFASWIAILLDVAYRATANHGLLRTAAVVAIGTYICLALASVYRYYIYLRQAITASLDAAQWTHEISEILYVYNPYASNSSRAEKWMNNLSGQLHRRPRKVDITTQEATLRAHIRQLKPDDVVLVAVAGGDGTVHSVVNTLIATPLAYKTTKLYVLPLWGGNANDFSYMLNGLHNTTTAKRLLAHSAPASVPLIRVKIHGKAMSKTIYACCYATFGASAYAARQLDQHRSTSRRVARWFPPLVILREFIAVMQALLTAPAHSGIIGQTDANFFEHTIINGSRIAKVNRVPIGLSEPLFFHAVVRKKGPSIIVAIVRIVFGRADDVYSKQKEIHFTTKSSIDTQVDGEVMRLGVGTQVTASVYANHLQFISTKLPT